MINVPEPCHEDWNNMTPKEQGRHCNSCNKLVHDFSASSLAEIAQTLKKSATQVCGKFRPDQVVTPPKWSLPILSKFCYALLLVFGAQLFSGNSLFAQVQSEEKDGVTVYYSDSTFTIKGVVIDKETKEQLPFVNLYIDVEGVQYGTSTDFDGKFTLQMDKGQIVMLEQFDLNISYIGYDKKQIQNIPVNKGKFIDMGTIEMSMDGQLLLGMVVGTYAIPLIDKDPDAHRKTTFDRRDIQNFPRY
jgi:hypothetical protein